MNDSISSTADSADFAKATFDKVVGRLVPFLFVCYIVAFLDRVNVGFAKLQMGQDLGFSETVFGLGAGIWTKDVATMHKLAAKIKSGTVWGNCHAMIDTALPFGGYKESGIGREQGKAGIDAYLETKTVIIQL